MVKFSICAGLLSCVLLPVTAPAEARTCGVAGDWQLAQSNGPTVNLRVVQVGNQLFGDAQYARTTGVIRNGRINERALSFTINWRSGPIGEYVGGVRDGRMSGRTFDIRTPRSQATWFVTRTFGC